MAVARYVYQSPAALPFLLLSSAALLVAGVVDEATGAVPELADALISVAIGSVLGRAAFVALIEDRNRVLASNIRRSCLLSAGATPAEGGDAVVVAILGMAHLEGVRDALMDAAEPTAQT